MFQLGPICMGHPELGTLLKVFTTNVIEFSRLGSERNLEAEMDNTRMKTYIT